MLLTNLIDVICTVPYTLFENLGAGTLYYFPEGYINTFQTIDLLHIQ